MALRKAQRSKSKLRIGLFGVTGSGKTLSALYMAAGLGGEVALIDTEHGSGDLYSDKAEIKKLYPNGYNIMTLTPPFSVEKYRAAIKECEDAGMNVIIIDSLSHAWAGEGGLLDYQGQLESGGKYKNSFATWREVTPLHNKLVTELLDSPAHIIATLRSKTEYVLEDDGKGRKVPRKIGLAPVFRDGIEYEFTLVMDIAENHMARATKDRTSLFNMWGDHITAETGKQIMAWLETGADLPPDLRVLAKEFAEKLKAQKTLETLDAAWAEGAPIMERLKVELPEWHDKYAGSITQLRAKLQPPHNEAEKEPEKQPEAPPPVLDKKKIADAFKKDGVCVAGTEVVQTQRI